MSFFKQLGNTAKKITGDVTSTLRSTIIPGATRTLNSVPLQKFTAPTSSGSQQMYSPSGEWEGPGNAPNTFGLEPHAEAALKAAEPYIWKLDAIGRSKISGMTHAAREKIKDVVKAQTYREIDGSNTMTERQQIDLLKWYIDTFCDCPKPFELRGGRTRKRRSNRRNHSRK